MTSSIPSPKEPLGLKGVLSLGAPSAGMTLSPITSLTEISNIVTSGATGIAISLLDRHAQPLQLSAEPWIDPLTGLPFVWSPDLGHDHLLADPAAAPNTSPSSMRQAAALSAATATLAMAQHRTISPDLWQQLRRIEMPAALEHALISLHGVQLDRYRCRRLLAAMPAIVAGLMRRLADTGLTHPDNEQALAKWLAKLKVLDAFEMVNGRPRVDDDALKEAQHRCPELHVLRQLRRVQDLAGKPWLAGMMTSVDGRVHPQHVPLQAPTTRTATRAPGITGLPKPLRPLIVAGPGMGLAELDYKGAEILVAAIVFDDEKLLAAYGSGDVISALTKVIFTQVQHLSLKDIAEHHDDLRGQAKTITYGVIYGRKARSLARKLGISEMAAQRLIDRLMAFCPKVSAGMKQRVLHARRRGRIPIAFGLVRHLPKEEWSMPWKVETLAKNTPIQGTAAIVFRYAMILVARAIEPLGGKIVLPMHDAFLLEGPVEHLASIITTAKQAMIDAFAMISPTARPFVEVEDKDTSCWNKKGRVADFDKYLVDPIFDEPKPEPVRKLEGGTRLWS